MDSTAKTACFTGHRAIKDADATQKRLEEVLEALILDGYISFLTGGARGFDALAAEAVLKMKESHPNVRLTIVLPYENSYKHESGWSSSDISLHKSQLDRADKQIVLQNGYSRGCYFVRNRYLVDNSNICVAYQTQASGGTAYTVKYAKRKNIDIINIV